MGFIGMDVLLGSVEGVEGVLYFVDEEYGLACAPGGEAVEVDDE